MLARLTADAVLLLHLGFIVFVMLGGFLVVRWPRLMLLHVPAVIWGAFVESTGSICPLTFVENHLRMAAGASGYAGSFVEHYLLGVIYPAGLSRPVQYGLALLVIAVNGAIYAWLLQAESERRATKRAATRSSRRPKTAGT